MPDYNLGRARGVIDIDYDGGAARRAQADMAATAAEAEALDRSMGRVNQQFDRHREVQISTAEEIVRARGEVDELRRVYQELQRDYERADRALTEAQQHRHDVLVDHRDNLEEVRRSQIELTRAEQEAERAAARAADAYDNYRNHMIAVRHEIDRFNASHVGAANGFRNMSQAAERFGNVLESLDEKLSGVARILGQLGLFGLLGGAAGGQLFSVLAGGANILSVALAAVVEVGEALLGVLAMIPAAVNAAVLGIGSLAVAFQGVGEALGAMGDPRKFVEAIRDLSPAAQQAMLTLYSFRDAFRGVRYAVQESLFAPIVAEIQPLVMTWLPMLQDAMSTIAGQFGQSFRQVFQYFMTPEARAGFQNFVQNMVTGFEAARGAIQPFLEAWNTLADIGSDLFPRLGAAITDVMEKFNAWIQRSAENGNLERFLNKTLDQITFLGRTVRDLGFGLSNMLGIFTGVQGSSALETIANLAAKFREWTQSVSGQDAMFSFFSLIRTAAQAVRPALSLLGDSFAIIGRTLTELGIAVQPGLISFFESFKTALQSLAPHVLAMAPAINQFLVAFGQTLVQVVNSLGPQLPALMEDLSEAFISIMQVIPPVAAIFAEFLSHVTPEQVAIFLGLVGALKLLSATMSVVNVVMMANPFALAVAGAAAFAAAAFLIVQNWDQVKTTLSNVWQSITESLGGLWDSISGWFDRQDWGELGMKILRGIASVFTTGADWVGEAFGNVMQAIRDRIPSSPARKGPFSERSPEQLGAMMVSAYAGGMLSGRPEIASASDVIAGQAAAIGRPSAGFGSMGFSTAGVSATSGGDVTQGRSGFDQWVNFITQDLTAWGNIFNNAFQLVDSIGKIITDTVRVVANLWNGGDNPLTRPGGLMGPPLPISQQQVPGVQNRPIPGVAPDQWGRDLAAMQGRGTPGQVDVPGVTERGEGGRPSRTEPAQTQGQAPPSTQGQAPAAGEMMVPITRRPDGTYTSPDPAWAHLIERESGGDPTIRQKIDDINSQRGDPATGMFQIIGATWRAAGGEEFAPSAAEATPEQQAIVAARVFAQDPGAWGAFRHAGREDPEALRRGLVPAPGVGPPAGATGAAPASFPITERPTPLHGGPIDPSKFFVHTSESDMGPAELADWMKAQGDRSYNYLIDPNTGAITQAVPAGTAAWAVGSPGNEQSINAVIAGSYAGWSREEWLSRPAALQSLAWLAARDAQRFNIPIQQLGPGGTAGIGGHDWVARNLGGTDHTDPGKDFPWPEFMDMVRTYASGGTPATGPGGTPVGAFGSPEGAAGAPGIPAIPDALDDLAGSEAALPGLLVATGASAYVAQRATRAYISAVRKSRAAERAGTVIDLTPEERLAVQRVAPVANRLPPEMRIPQTNLGGRSLPGGDFRGAPSGGWITATPENPYGGVPRGQTGAGMRNPTPPPVAGKPRPPAGATVPRVPPGPRAPGPDTLRARIQAISRAGGRVFGPMLTFLSGAAVSYGVVDEAVSQVEQELIAKGHHFTTDGSVLGIPVISSSIEIDSGAVERATPGTTAGNTAEQQRIVDEFNRGRSPGEQTLYFNQLPSDWQDRLRPGPPGVGSGLGAKTGITATGGPPTRTTPVTPTSADKPIEGVGFSANPRSLADIPLRGSTASAVAAAGLAPLYRPGTEEIPQGIKDLAAAFNLQVSTYTSGDSLHEAGFAFDFTGAPEDMNAFAQFAMDNLAPQTLELIHMNERTGQRWEIAGTRRVGPGTDLPNYYASTIGQHGTFGKNAHVHWATDVLPLAGGQPAGRGAGRTWIPGPGQRPRRWVPGRGWVVDEAAGATSPSAGPPRTNTADDWMNVPPGWDLNNPIPPEVIAANTGLTPEQIAQMPPMYYNAAPGTVENVPVGPDYRGPYPVTPGGTISVPTTTGAPVPGFPETNDQRTPLEKFTSGMQAVGSIASSAFQVFQDVIASIQAGANITRTLVRGFENTETVVNFITQFQQFIKTGASIAKLVGDVGGVIAASGQGDPTGGASAIGGGIQAVAGIVQGALEAWNNAITLGIDIYHQIGKYAGFFFGMNLGGDATGPLGGNVRMLLNTRTNELMTYNEDNPLNKNVFQLPRWQQSYDRPGPAPQLAPMINIYTGPGQTPREMMSESMWLIGTGAPSVASVSGVE